MLETVQLLRDWLNDVLSANILSVVFTLDTFQLFSGLL